jgi:organic radical activating enzyme
MNVFRNLMERYFPNIQPLPAGVYHYQAPPEAPYPYRLHLRIEPDGRGLLIVNASTVVHLNQTATEYAYHLIQHTSEDEAVAAIAKRYNVKKETVREDYRDLISRLEAMIDTPDLDPIAFLDFDRQEPYTSIGSAPYRLDCALTYRLPDAGARELAPLDRVSRELTSDEWKQVLKTAWDAGVPHAVFTGGEPTMRPDLVDLVTYAEELGMVTGLITSGSRLAEKDYLNDLLQAGLDHVMILLNPNDEQSIEALRKTLAQDIAVIVHLTLSPRTIRRFDALIEQLQEMGVQNLSLSAETLDMKDELQAKRDWLAEHELHLVWDLPVPYSEYNPVTVELSAESGERKVESSGPGHAWLYVEPDGDVLPGQGHYLEVLGNMLVDPWEKIWEKAG